MAAATVSASNLGRFDATAGMTAIKITVTASSTTYTTTTGGLPFDLAGVLTQVSPYEAQINPLDVYTVVPMGLSTNGYLPGGFTPGTPTWNAVSGSSFGTGTIATFPCTIRLYGIGANNSSHSALGEVADGSNSDAFTALLIYARGGQNNSQT